MVHKVMKDVERRKSNIVVSGLRARVGIDDSTLFTSICEQHLSIRPPNVRCRRIDKTDRPSNPNGKNLPSRLLVHLRSESLATEILDRARQLRFSTDDDVRLNVYFSRDMTPEESKLAFEERVRRRKRKNEASNANHTVSIDVRSHPPGSTIDQSFAGASNGPGSTALQTVPTSYGLDFGDISQFPPLVRSVPDSDVCHSWHSSTGPSQWIASGPPVNNGSSAVQQRIFIPHTLVPSNQNNISAIQPGLFQPPVSIQPGVHSVSSNYPGSSAVQLDPQCPPVYFSTSAIQPSIHASCHNQSVPRSSDVNVSTHHFALQQPSQVVAAGQPTVNNLILILT